MVRSGGTDDIIGEAGDDLIDTLLDGGEGSDTLR